MRSRRLVAAAVAATALAVPASASAAEEFAAVTNSNKVITFGSDGPGNLDSVYPITGLVSGEKIVGIDTRPATGQLYALGKTGRLYVLDSSSGRTRLVATLSTIPTGTTFGFNFNPTVDRIRVTTDTRQDLRVNPDTGAAVVDDPLTYAPGQGAGAAPAVGGVAYSNPFPNATTTQLFDIEAGKNALVLQNPPNNGLLTTVGTGLGQDVNGPSGFDINQSNIGYASYKPAATGPVNLYKVDVRSGKAVGSAAQPGIGTRAAPDDTIAIAAIGTVNDDKRRPKLTADSPTSANRVNLSKGRSFLADIGLNESGRIQLDMRIGKTLIAQGKAEVYTYAGSTRMRIRATDDGRKILASKKYKSAKMRFSARDRAGNLTKQGVRSFTLR